MITLRDGIRLSASVTLPADEDGNPAPGPFPVVATFTGYNQALGLIGAADPYLVKRGYAYIIADLRGTGASEGTWQAFGKPTTRTSANYSITSMPNPGATAPWA